MKGLALIQFKCVQSTRTSKTKESFYETNRERLHNPQGPLAFIEAKFNMWFSLTIYTLANLAIERAQRMHIKEERLS